MSQWLVDSPFNVDGLEFVVRNGDKFPGDLVLWVRGSDGRWRMAHMSLPFMMIDFMADNEDRRRHHVSYWRENGQRYFLAACIDAVQHGWREATEKIVRQRGRIE